MSRPPLIFLSIPGLRPRDLAGMPQLQSLASGCDQHRLRPSFPCVTWPVQANMLTGKLPNDHGIVANGIYDRQRHRVEMWTMPNSVILAPPVWERLKTAQPDAATAVWFPMLAKQCSADYACMPAPVHNPDGSESLWCYSQPTELYGDLLEQLGHFPLQNFWGPAASIASSEWIIRSSTIAAQKHRPAFCYIYLPHLDYAAQRSGPDSDAANWALRELDGALAVLQREMLDAYQPAAPVWMVASEYVITPVQAVTYPNRILRELGLLQINEVDGQEQLDLAQSRAWCLVDHQCGHVFVQDPDASVVRRIEQAMGQQDGIDRVLTGDSLAEFSLDHPRAGDVVLVSRADAWQAYYWWYDEHRAPDFAKRVDIHSKPGYDPVELFWDREANGVPLDATLVRGSHGAPALEGSQLGAFLCPAGLLPDNAMIRDIDVCEIIAQAVMRLQVDA